MKYEKKIKKLFFGGKIILKKSQSLSQIARLTIACGWCGNVVAWCGCGTRYILDTYPKNLKCDKIYPAVDTGSPNKIHSVV